MPTYVYKFVETGETIEVQQAFTDDALTQALHPSTGKMMDVRKVFTPVGVTFKGGGFYKTDTRGASSGSSGSSGGTNSANDTTSTGATTAASSASSPGTSSSGTSSSGTSSSGTSSSTSTGSASAP